MSDLYNTTPPPKLLNDDLGGCFGMCEMEVASRIIVRRCVEAGTWQIDFNRTMFIGVNPHNTTALDGFDELIDHGWLERKHGDHWQVVSDYVKRLMRERPEAFRIIAADFE